MNVYFIDGGTYEDEMQGGGRDCEVVFAETLGKAKVIALKTWLFHDGYLYLRGILLAKGVDSPSGVAEYNSLYWDSPRISEWLEET